MKILTIIVRVILGLIVLLAAREVVMVAGDKALRTIRSRRTAPQSSKSHWQSIKDTFPDHAGDLDSPEIVAERRRSLLEDEDEYLRRAAKELRDKHAPQ